MAPRNLMFKNRFIGSRFRSSGDPLPSSHSVRYNTQHSELNRVGFVYVPRPPERLSYGSIATTDKQPAGEVAVQNGAAHILQSSWSECWREASRRHSCCLIKLHICIHISKETHEPSVLYIFISFIKNAPQVFSELDICFTVEKPFLFTFLARIQFVQVNFESVSLNPTLFNIYFRGPLKVGWIYDSSFELLLNLVCHVFSHCRVTWNKAEQMYSYSTFIPPCTEQPKMLHRSQRK